MSDHHGQNARFRAQTELVARLRSALESANAEIERLGGLTVRAELNDGKPMLTPRHRHVPIEPPDVPFPHHCVCGKAVFILLPGRKTPGWFHPRPNRPLPPDATQKPQ